MHSFMNQAYSLYPMVEPEMLMMMIRRTTKLCDAEENMWYKIHERLTRE